MWITLSRTGKAKIAIAWFFFVTGATLGNWAALLPAVEDEQDISNGELGLILLAAVGGALMALPIITYCNNNYGSGWSTMGSGVIMVLFFPLVGVVYNVGVFTTGVFLLGFVIGCLDVSANGQAVICEKMTRAPTVGLFHAIYSFGAFTGAILGGIVMEQEGATVLKEVVLFGLTLFLPGMLLSPWLYSYQEERLLMELHDRQYEQLLQSEHAEKGTATNPLVEREGQQDGDDRDGSVDIRESEGLIKDEKGRDLPFAALLKRCGFASWVKYITMAQIAFLALLACFGEGSVNDWSVIYFTDSLNASPFVSTLGFAGFELTVACGRYFSDYAVAALGRRKLMVASGVLACLGMGIVVLAPSLVSLQQNQAALQGLTIVGFSVCGLGLSSLAPSAISLAGSNAISKAAGVTPAESIAMVTSVSYLGIMIGPPFLGGMSVVLHSLRWCFAIAGALITPIAVIAMCISRKAFESYDQGIGRGRDADVHSDVVVLRT